MKSNNPILNEGWYRGLPIEVEKITGFTKPTILLTLKSGLINTPTRELIVSTGVELARRHIEKKKSLVV